MNNNTDTLDIAEEDEENTMSYAEGKAALHLAATQCSLHRTEKRSNCRRCNVYWNDFANKKTLGLKRKFWKKLQIFLIA